MLVESTFAEPASAMLGGRWAAGLGAALVLLLAGVEAAHWQSTAQSTDQLVQQPVPITTPATHPDPSAPDPGDNP